MAKQSAESMFKHVCLPQPQIGTGVGTSRYTEAFLREAEKISPCEKSPTSTVGADPRQYWPMRQARQERCAFLLTGDPFGISTETGRGELAIDVQVAGGLQQSLDLSATAQWLNLQHFDLSAPAQWIELQRVDSPAAAQWLILQHLNLSTAVRWIDSSYDLGPTAGSSRGIESKPSQENIGDSPTSLLQQLESASAKARGGVFRTLLDKSDPVEVLFSAFALYDQYGRESFLLHAVSLLEAFGDNAWPALRKVARSRRPEVELFVALIARCPGVPANERTEAILALTRNPSVAVRQRIMEHLERIENLDAPRVLKRLAADLDPDLRAEASEQLEALVGKATVG